MTAEASLEQYQRDCELDTRNAEAYEAEVYENWRHNDDRFEWIEDVIVQTDFVATLERISSLDDAADIKAELKIFYSAAENKALGNYLTHKMKERGWVV